MSCRVDVHVCRRIRQFWRILYPTQEEIARRLGVELQQLYKYEARAILACVNRLSALVAIRQVPATDFLDGVEGRVEKTDPIPGDMLKDREAQSLVRASYAVPRERRRRLFDFAKVLAAIGWSLSGETPEAA